MNDARLNVGMTADIFIEFTLVKLGEESKRDQ
jgi:hypothetical protein